MAVRAARLDLAASSRSQDAPIWQRPVSGAGSLCPWGPESSIGLDRPYLMEFGPCYSLWNLVWERGLMWGALARVPDSAK